jgi:hypothetical protein
MVREEMKRLALVGETTIELVLGITGFGTQT